MVVVVTQSHDQEVMGSALAVVLQKIDNLSTLYLKLKTSMSILNLTTFVATSVYSCLKLQAC